jgi:REP element-mobilizing transposase RayT
MRPQSKSVNAKVGHQRFLRGGRHSTPFTCYSITKCVEGRKKVLGSDAPAGVIISAFDWLRQQEKIRLLAFCIMPDHFHVLFVLLSQNSLVEIMRSLGKFTAAQINKCLCARGQFWQDGFHDHCCRSNDEVLELLTYIKFNPVRAGLVADASLWPYSSACPSNAVLLDRQWYQERC